MSKKAPRIVPSDKALTANPFAALGSLKETLPIGQTAPPESSPKPAANSPISNAAKIVVRKERKGHGGKTVTVVEGIAASAAEVVCGTMKRALGCGARVENGAIVLQGDIGDRASAWLEQNGAKRVVRGT